MLQRKEEELLKRQAVERRALPKRIRAERKAREMMFRESLRISTNLDPDAERDKVKKVIQNIADNTNYHSIGSVIKMIPFSVSRAREKAIYSRATTLRY